MSHEIGSTIIIIMKACWNWLVAGCCLSFGILWLCGDHPTDGDPNIALNGLSVDPSHLGPPGMSREEFAKLVLEHVYKVPVSEQPNVPVKFYGVTVDEFGKAAPKVRIGMSGM